MRARKFSVAIRPAPERLHGKTEVIWLIFRKPIEFLYRSKKRSQVSYHPALPWVELPAFIRELEQRPRRAARVLHLLILTATRTNEVRFVRPEEFDMDNRIRAIPGDRTKSGRPLRVPLCERAVENGMQVVEGSNPLSPTKKIKTLWMHVHKAFFVWGGFCPHVCPHTTDGSRGNRAELSA